MKLSDEERRYIRSRWNLLQRAQKLADSSSKKWVDLNTKLNVWLDQSGHDDIVQRDKIKGQNITLKGHLATWDFHRRDADRFASEILAFEAMKRMEAL